MDRRTILAAAGAAIVAPAASAKPARKRRAKGQAVVLVHGAWHGGWCWRDVRDLLIADGARVFTPTLTGLAERAHLRDPVPTLATHIADVMGVIEAEELREVVLVGHSYGGMVVTGVADRLKEKISHVVYLDAALPRDGETMLTQNPNATPAMVEATVAQLKMLAPDGVWMNPIPAAALGVPAGSAQAAWVDRRMTPHPLPSWTEPIGLRRGGAEGLARTYVLCDNPILPNTAFPSHAARVARGEAGAGWRSVSLNTGHDAMVTMPRQTADIIRAAFS
jgi:pimeloyl-ACP methyl ester carboxylesterase